MAISIQLLDYAEEKKLYGYSLFSTTLALLFLGLFLLLKKDWSTHSATKLPIVGIESPGYFGIANARSNFVANGFHILRNAYQKYPGKNFVVTTYGHDKVVLTHEQVKELSNAPDDTISSSHAAAETLMGEYTGLDRFVDTKYVEDVVRVKLTQNLVIGVKINKKNPDPEHTPSPDSKLFHQYSDSELLTKIQSTATLKEAILEETRFALNTELPECTTGEWTPVDIFTLIIRMVARMSGRAFVGLPLCRNEDWLKITIQFTTDVFMTQSKLTSVPKLFRPLYVFMRGSAKDLAGDRKKAESLLAPIIRKRLEEERLAEKNGTVIRKHNDMLEWLSDRVHPQDKNLEVLSELQLILSLASIHSTSLSFFNAILDLAEHQEYIQPIREEIEAIISANNGVLDRAALRKMRKTDSFFKESMRGKIGLSMFLTFREVSFNRKVLKDYTLSDGTYLPKGTLIAAPTLMFSTDPDFIEDPGVFDGFRWYKKSLETERGAGRRHYWATTASNDLTFGHGKHACPGRFFATEEMKIILTFILLQYDIKYPEGQSRPANINRGEFSTPDATQKLLLKKLPGPKKFSFL
ncbi:cytochrome P450 [Tuber magnatum]|uniref:Cytochrome P450 n=1 Tax=Tuber magnatum TaxID=42249 RepID=A0A317T1A9_9PEZI|nr:cytochrome P450 [Tuber magnatum]